jgi:hypothetical protein
MKRPRCEDESKWINLQQLKDECKNSSKEMIYAGTDYGVITVPTTVSMTDGQYKRHLEFYNEYACLEVDPLPQKEEQESIPILRKPFRVTAGEIDQRALSRSMHINANVGTRDGQTFKLLKTDLVNTV